MKEHEHDWDKSDPLYYICNICGTVVGKNAHAVPNNHATILTSNPDPVVALLEQIEQNTRRIAVAVENLSSNSDGLYGTIQDIEQNTRRDESDLAKYYEGEISQCHRNLRTLQERINRLRYSLRDTGRTEDEIDEIVNGDE